MKIGILTFHLAHNYGAVLQCYALQEVLRSMGYDACVIDYQQPFMVEHFHPKRYWGIRSFISTLIHGDMREYTYRAKLPYVRYYNFQKFKSRYLHLTDKCYGTDDIPPMDLYIVGSDQPWNPDLTGGTDFVYYGQFARPQDSRIITYAMSGSEYAIGKVGWNNIKFYCENFDTLSFREENITDKFSKLTCRECKTVLDPTLIANPILWEPMLNKKWADKKYILLYHVGGPQDVISTMTIKTKDMAEKENLEFIDASDYLYSPSDFVSLIRYAQCIVTASFHALAFSIVFKKKFVAVYTGQHSDVRLQNILHIVALEKYMVEPFAISMPANPNYENLKSRLNYFQNESFCFLSNQTLKKN